MDHRLLFFLITATQFALGESRLGEAEPSISQEERKERHAKPKEAVEEQTALKRRQRRVGLGGRPVAGEVGHRAKAEGLDKAAPVAPFRLGPHHAGEDAFQHDEHDDADALRQSCRISEAIIAVQTTNESWYEADIHRIAGEIALTSPEPDAVKAEAYFERALAVAHQQQAKSWELRAAISMARLWRSQGKRQQAREQLAPVYGWFTEGFDTLDLKEAKVLLEELHA